ncbi:hypothetical protein [Nocardia goodfellowii]|uniref:HipA N-terminal subdomain 1 domain-containing protein n=1 Tax=Nocardia goodfellowii TaxID=882446 RepID=A0ABS4Q9U0_9NOCA|nr:hypothetical protein [Nocardia goodfellowii]MBP2188459.1 hypothetical protein [Nocardia goodfellowii]
MTSFEDFRHIGRADVYKAGRLAAILLRNPDGSTEFRYLPEYRRPMKSQSRPIALRGIAATRVQRELRWRRDEIEQS